MPVPPKSRRVVLCGATVALALAFGATAHAQLGSVNNPPPQNLFHFNDNPKRLDDGLGSMAERRRELARRRARRPVHRPTQ